MSGNFSGDGKNRLKAQMVGRARRTRAFALNL
uniref:Uncharacterized protein n=1 Tax=Rhizophora mucronata TaxID=61149 RepID=A0A2P2PS38_RHIMU